MGLLKSLSLNIRALFRALLKQRPYSKQCWNLKIFLPRRFCVDSFYLTSYKTKEKNALLTLSDLNWKENKALQSLELSRIHKNRFHVKSWRKFPKYHSVMHEVKKCRQLEHVSLLCFNEKMTLENNGLQPLKFPIVPFQNPLKITVLYLKLN